MSIQEPLLQHCSQLLLEANKLEAFCSVRITETQDVEYCVLGFEATTEPKDRVYTARALRHLADKVENGLPPFGP